MSMIPVFPEPDPSDVALLQQIQQIWNNGNMPAATDLLRNRAATGEPWTAAMLAWMLMQQGVPAIGESVTWAIKAAELGAPWQAQHTFNNALNLINQDPSLAARLPELWKWATPWLGSPDIAGQAWNLTAQGQPQLAIQLMKISTPWPSPDPALSALVDSARQRNDELERMSGAARDQKSAFDSEIEATRAAILKEQDDLETSVRTAKLLVQSVTSTAVNSLYLADAERNTKESKGVWHFGLAVLAAAAFVAVFPVILHYSGVGPDYTGFEQIALHLVSTAALGTFAGVLLARARARDHAAQRANDLSTAMGTMISYSDQIRDPAEKQRFMMTMGQLILQAHLTTGSGSKSAKDDSMAGMLALVNVLRQGAVGPAAGQVQP